MLSVVRSLVLMLALAACSPDVPTALERSTDKLSSHSGGTSGPSGPGGATLDAAEPHFLVADSGAPAIANPVIQFWAKKGVDQTARMYYVAGATGHDSVVFFSLRVRARSLLRRPDGTPIAVGDSVLITLTLVDPQHLVVDCQPSGLLFDPRSPATVRISYANSELDPADDAAAGAVSSNLLTHALSIWRRESVNAPWFAVLSHEVPEASEMEADIGGFTGYALAW